VVTLSVFTGGDCQLVLPVREPRPEDARLAPFAAPEQSPPADFETLVPPGSGGRVMTWDVDTNTLEYEFRWVDGGRYLVRHPALGDIETEDHLTYYYRITEGDPLSARSWLAAKSVLKRGELLDVEIDTDCELSSDAHNFTMTSNQHVFERGVEIFARKSEKTIARDLG
jgi:hypothetical protein